MAKPTFNLLGDIVQDDATRFYASDVAPAMFIGWLAKQDGDIAVNINSLGGNVMGGLAIANAIKGYTKGTVTARVLGIAASMASVIACAADTLEIADGAFMMIHNPWTVAMGDADELRKSADVLDQIKSSIIGFYQSKYTGEPETLAAAMDAETWMTREEAVAALWNVAAPAIEEGETEIKAAAAVSARVWENAPEAAKALFAGKGEPISAECGVLNAEISAEPATDNSELRTPNSELENWQARYKGASRKITELQAAASDSARLLADAKAALETATARIAELETENADFKSRLAETSRNLADAQASAKQFEADCENAKRELSETKAALERETERYRLQVGQALQQPGANGATPKGYALIRSKFPNT